MKTNVPSSNLKDVTLTLLGKQRPPIRRKVFCSSDFIVPGTLESRKLPKTREMKMQAWAHTPLSQAEIGLLTCPKTFHHLAKVIDTPKLTLRIPYQDLKIRVDAFQEEALQAYPKLKLCKALETHAKAKYGHSYSDLVGAASKKVIDRFKAAFDENMVEHPMNDINFSRQRKNAFSHSPIWAPTSVIKEYKTLARKGHVYSQYLAGVLLGSHVCDYSPECIDYLLMAYENQHPEAMRVLAEYLLYREDYYGALQCALLSVDGGDRHSKNVVRNVLGTCSHMVVMGPQGIGSLSASLIDTARQDGFESVLRKHFSEFFQTPSEKAAAIMNHLFRNTTAETHHDDLEEHTCLGCGCAVSEDDFEFVDDELNPDNPHCPDCQSAKRIARNECDCGEPAVYEVDSGFLCEDCHDHYVSGYMRD